MSALRESPGRERPLNSISCLANPFVVRAVSAAKEAPLAFHTVADDAAPTVKARWSERLDSTLKTIECVVLSLYDYVKRFIVGVVANHACAHSALLT